MDRIAADGLNPEHLHEALQAKIGNWRKWKKWLAQRPAPSSLRKLLSANVLFWGQPTEFIIHQSTAARLLQLRNTIGKHERGFDWAEAAQSWEQEIREEVSLPRVLEALAWAQASRTLTTRLSEEDWRRLVVALISLAGLKDQPNDDPILSFVVHSELPLTLAHVLPELFKDQREVARRQFSQRIDALLDGEGMPHARHLSDIQVLLASCTRALTLDKEIKKGRIDKAARLQFDWLCRQTLRWSRPDGTAIFTDSGDAPFFDELIKAALKLTQDEPDGLAYKSLRGKRKTISADAPPPTEHSEWSEAATMRANWLPEAPRLAVSFPSGEFNLELAVGPHRILSGSCMPSIIVDDEPMAVESDWEEVCWETDDDMDYIELECSLSNGWRLQRQLLLAREDQFALLADALLGPQTSSIQYRHPLPLSDGVLIEQSDENTEASILGDKPLGTILPLSLPEWQSERRNDRLRCDPARLEIACRGSALYAPLFIDLDPARRRKALTWRRLTVAEELQITSPDTAVAYRVQIGKRQWAIYRSLAKPGNRTFLGINLISEFLVARFDTDGEIEPLIDVSI